MSASAASPDEGDLLSRLQRGEADAFETLVRSHGGRMLAVTRRLLRNEDDARDAVQEAFMSAFRALASFQGDCQLSTWLHRIAVNAALMRLRTRRRKPEDSIEDLLPTFLEDGHHAVHPPEWRSTPHELLARREDCEFVRDCIDQLPDTYRSVLILRDVEEMDTEETAALLGLNPGAVKVRLHRARQALRGLLEPRFRRGVA